MIEIQLRFYEELNDFLPVERRKQSFAYSVAERTSVKDVIESLGVPHTEVDLVLVNGESVGFDYKVKAGDKISVYPVFESFDISHVVRLRPEPLRVTKFILDVHLGKLARYLRLLGFDVVYDNSYADPEIVKRGVEEKRIILTRDIGLLKNKIVTHGYWMRETNLDKQIDEVLKRFDLYKQIKPFIRCLECNGILESIDKRLVLELLPPMTQELYHNFMRCPDCKRIYWEGSHYQKLKSWLIKHKLSEFS